MTEGEILNLQQSALSFTMDAVSRSSEILRRFQKTKGRKVSKKEVKTAWHLSKPANSDLVPMAACTPYRLLTS